MVTQELLELAMEVRQVLRDELILEKVTTADYVSCQFIAHELKLESHVCCSLSLKLNHVSCACVVIIVCFLRWNCFVLF